MKSKNGFTPLEINGEKKKYIPERSLTGFTLIELLVAIFVLTVGIVWILQAFPFGTGLQKASEMQTTAIELCQAKMEEIISHSYDELSLGTVEEGYGFDPTSPAFKRKTEVSYFDPQNPSTPPLQDLGIKKIETFVFWRSPFSVSEKEVKLATLIAKR